MQEEARTEAESHQQAPTLIDMDCTYQYTGTKYYLNNALYIFQVNSPQYMYVGTSFRN